MGVLSAVIAIPGKVPAGVDLNNLPDSNSNPARGLAGVVYLPLVGRRGESRGEFSSTPMT